MAVFSQCLSHLDTQPFTCLPSASQTLGVDSGVLGAWVTCTPNNVERMQTTEIHPPERSLMYSHSVSSYPAPQISRVIQIPAGMRNSQTGCWRGHTKDLTDRGSNTCHFQEWLTMRIHSSQSLGGCACGSLNVQPPFRVRPWGLSASVQSAH